MVGLPSYKMPTKRMLKSVFVTRRIMFKLILIPGHENWNTMVLYCVVLSLELV